ncbi:MAG: mitofilin family membrane protein [Micropepsaceae bacterium]
MTDIDAKDTPPEAPTPGDIEAALSDLRVQIGAPEAPPLPPPPPVVQRRGPGWGASLALMLAAGVAGGVGASFLGSGPAAVRSQTPDNGAEARIAALEDRLSRLPEKAGVDPAALSDLAADIEGLNVRVRALEAAEAAQPTPGVTPPAGAGPETAALTAALADLMSRMDALETRLNALPATPAMPLEPQADPQIAADIAALKMGLAELVTRLASLEQAAPASELIASLDGRLSALEDADPGRASRQAALALIVARLGAAADEGRPFTAELTALKAAAPATDTSAFEAYAAKGLPTVRALAEGLEAIDGAVRDAADYERGGDFFDRLWRGIGRLVTVRVDGLAEGREPEDHLARAQYHAGRGDLNYAYAEMDALTGAPRGAAAVWLADAKARLALDAGLNDLTARILADLARPAP